MPNDDTYEWIGGTAGTWAVAANWEDLTIGMVAAVAPGVGSTVTIGAGITIAGTGTAASLTLLGSDTVLGDINTGTLLATGPLTIASDGSLDVNTATVTGSLIADGGTLIASTLQAAAVTVTDGALIETDSLSIPNGALVIGSNGPSQAGEIEVGQSGTGSPGALTIDPGYTLTAGTLELPGFPEGLFSLNNVVVDNGLLSVANLQLGDYLVVYSSPFTDYFIQATVEGAGTIEVQPSGSLDLVANAPSAGLTFQLDGGSTITIQSTIAAGNTIDLVGSGNVLEVELPFEADIAGSSFNGRDHYPAPEVDAAIEGFNSTDTIILSNVGLSSVTDAASGVSLALTNGTTLDLQGTFSAGQFTATLISGSETISPESGLSPNVTQVVVTPAQLIPCFAAGTRIATPLGMVAVERLKEGDLVTTVSGTAQPVQWIGRRTIDCRRHPDPDRVRPVRIEPHAFGDGRPARALLLSPDHAVFVEDVLIPIKFLLNGFTVTQRRVARVTYFHIELARHDVVLAEGLPAETYLETGGRAAFENGGGPVALHPNFAGPDPDRVGMVWQNFACAPLLGSAETVERVRARMGWQASMLGYFDGGRKKAGRAC